jgi:hypothetical protein
MIVWEFDEIILMFVAILAVVLVSFYLRLKPKKK